MRNRVHLNLLKSIMIILFGFIITGSLQAAPKNNVSLPDDLAILVTSCDKYADLWSPFSQLLIKYWPELNTEYKDLNIYLISNAKEFKHPRIKNIMINPDLNWSDTMRQALQKIDAKYILILLEDYWLHTPVKDQEFWQAFATMRANGAAYLQVAHTVDDPDLSRKYPNNIVRKLQNAKYRTSLQAAIWEKNVLLDLLLFGENPWQFEKAGSIRSEQITLPFLAVISDPPIAYLNAANLGVIDVKVLQYLRDHEGIDLTKTKFKLRRSDAFRYVIRPYRRHIYISLVLLLVTAISSYIYINKLKRKRLLLVLN